MFTEVWLMKSLLHQNIDWSEVVARGCSVKKVFLKFLQNTVFQVFSCEFCEFSHRTPLVTASEWCQDNVSRQ